MKEVGRWAHSFFVYSNTICLAMIRKTVATWMVIGIRQKQTAKDKGENLLNTPKYLETLVCDKYDITNNRGKVTVH